MRFPHIAAGLLLTFSVACKTQKVKKTKIEVGPEPAVAVQKADSLETETTQATGIPAAGNSSEARVFFETTETNFGLVRLKTQIDIKSPRLNQSFPANIQIKKDSVIWVSVVVGLEAARAVINQDSIFLLDRLNRKYYKLSFTELSKQFNFDLNYTLIQSLLLGNMPIKPDSTDIYRKETAFNSILQKRNTIGITNKVDVNNNKLFTVEASDERTSSNMVINYKDFVQMEERILPRLISVIVNGVTAGQHANASVVFEHSRFDFSPGDIKFPFSIPRSFTEGKINF